MRVEILLIDGTCEVMHNIGSFDYNHGCLELYRDDNVVYICTLHHLIRASFLEDE